MLVLTRKKSESIIIGGVIRITAVEIRGDKVRIGITAPKEVEVHRAEVYKAIHGELPRHLLLTSEAFAHPLAGIAPTVADGETES